MHERLAGEDLLPLVNMFFGDGSESCVEPGFFQAKPLRAFDSVAVFAVWFEEELQFVKRFL